MRPYWATVIGIYEGVKGVTMPFAEKALEEMGIDGGGTGSTSGGYDHLGYSVLMNTYDEQLCPPDHTPTELTGQIEYSTTLTATLIPSLAQEKKRGLIDGKTTKHTELGALVNTFSTSKSTLLPNGKTLRLIPILPEGEEDTGLWQWNTGQTTREITVDTGWSYLYRVTYTNANGIKSQLCFSIATTDQGTPVGIQSVQKADKENHHTVEGVFDMNGRKLNCSGQVSHLPKGIYIINGKKVIL